MKFALIDNEDYDAFEEVGAMDAASIAQELEEASNIKDLEARYEPSYLTEKISTCSTGLGIPMYTK